MICPDPIEAIKFRLEQQGVDKKALIGIIGNRTRVYEVLRRDRALSLTMIQKLNQQLKIPGRNPDSPNLRAGRKNWQPEIYLPINTKKFADLPRSESSDLGAHGHLRWGGPLADRSQGLRALPGPKNGSWDTRTC